MSHSLCAGLVVAAFLSHPSELDDIIGLLIQDDELMMISEVIQVVVHPEHAQHSL